MRSARGGSTAGRRASSSPWWRWPSSSPSRGRSSCARARPRRHPGSRGSKGRTRGTAGTRSGERGWHVQRRRERQRRRRGGDSQRHDRERPAAGGVGLRRGDADESHRRATASSAGRAHRRRLAARLARRHAAARSTTRAWPAIVRTAVEDRDDAVGIKPLKDGDRTVWRAALTLGGQADRARRRPADRHRDLVQRRARDVHGERRLGVPAARRQDVPHRGAGGADGRDDARRRHLRRRRRRRRAAWPATTRSSPSWRRMATHSRPSPPSTTRTGRWSGSRGEPSAPRSGRRPRTAVIALLYTRGLSSLTVEQIGPLRRGAHSDRLSNELDVTARDKLSL